MFVLEFILVTQVSFSYFGGELNEASRHIWTVFPTGYSFRHRNTSNNKLWRYFISLA